MRKFVVKLGMRFVPSDDQIKKQPYFKEYSYKVIEKRGNKFLVRFFNGIGCGEDLFCKWELENMKLISE